MVSYVRVSPNMQNLSHGMELTFIPKRPHSKWQEWRNQQRAQQETDLFNATLWNTDALARLSLSEGLFPVEKLIWGKADIFRSKKLSSDKQPHDSWCLEVNNEPFKSNDIVTPGTAVYQALEWVFKVAKGQGLFPCVARKRKDGTLVEFPNGGGHQHVQIDFWEEGGSFLSKLYILERRLCLDFANNPWLRWFFAQWSDNLNSTIAIGLTDLSEISKATHNITKKQRKEWERNGLDSYIHDRGLLCHSIKQRIAYTGKPVRPTMEFRFLDMPRSVEELALHTQFISSWVGHHIDAVDEWGKGDFPMTHFDLTPKRFNRLTKDMGFVKGEIWRFLGEIGLDAKPYLDAFWERGYERRFRFGKFL